MVNPLKAEPPGQLGTLPTREFLRDYWQKKPVLIRNAFPDTSHWLSPDELAGLSLEDQVESRIVMENGPGNWELKEGPFAEDTFNTLPPSNWTLLVQAVDHYVPEFSHLLDSFRFLPAWRIDDVMVSYAVKGGSVGPHYDHYDVFLIQGMGQRTWQTGPVVDMAPPDDSGDRNQDLFLPGLSLKILKEFKSDREWVLNSGDMLYLPPGVPHWGVNETESMTTSVGFRAPSHSEIISDIGHYMSERLSDHDRYVDPDLMIAGNTGHISAQSTDKIKSILTDLINSEGAVEEWLARSQSLPKYGEKYGETEEHHKLDLKPEELSALVSNGDAIFRDESTRFLFTGPESAPEKLFINGNPTPFPTTAGSLVAILCQYRKVKLEWIRAHLENPLNQGFLLQLVNNGFLYLPSEQDSL